MAGYSSDSSDSLDAKPAPRYTVEDRQELITDLNSPWILSAEGLEQKERELNLREENLARKEKTLGNRENQLKAKISGPNWPVCCPLVYHNIEDQIPEEKQRAVRMSYYGFYATCFVFLGNIVGLALAAMVPRDFGDDDESPPPAPPSPPPSSPAPAPSAAPVPDDFKNLEIGSAFLSAFLAFVLIPFTFANFRILYAAAKKDKSSLYLMYVVIAIMFQCLVYIYFAIGIRGLGGMGVGLVIDGTSYIGAFIGIYVWVMMGAWIALAIYNVVVIIQVRALYHQAGGLAKAKSEAAKASAEQAAKHPEAAVTVASAVA